MRTKILIGLVLAAGLTVSCTPPSPDGKNSKIEKPPVKVEKVAPKPPANPAKVPPPPPVVTVKTPTPVAPPPPAVKVKAPRVKLVPGKNLLINPGFEKSRKGWTYPDWSKAWAKNGFAIKKGFALKGRRSARLLLNAGPDIEGTLIRGVVQELKPKKFPEVISGNYYIKEWKRGAPKQYLQLVVIVWQKKFNFPNHQIRYILAGVDTPPYNMRNAKYIFLNGPRVEPAVGQWVHFETNVLDNFKSQWNETPSGYDKVMFFFEARYDSKKKGSPNVKMDVYYDELFVGYK